MDEKYNIEKLADFLAIPDDRLDECLADFKQAVRMAKGMYGLLHAAAEVVSGQKIDTASYPEAAFPNFCWIDDGKREGVVRITSEGGELATFKYGKNA